MKKKGILIFLFVTMQLLTGCWSRYEVNDLSIVTATAIDKMEDGQIRLSVQIAVPLMLEQVGSGGSSGKSKSAVVISEKGKTVLEAYRKIREKLPRKLFFSHSGILVIGEKLARSGVYPVLDFFYRLRDFRLRNFVLFTKGEAADILNVQPTWEKIPSEEIRKEERKQIGLIVNLKDFLNMLVVEGIEPVAAQVTTKSSEIKNNSKSDSAKTPAEDQQSIAVAETAVFRKDKLIGWMNDQETTGIQFLRNELHSAMIPVNIPKKMGGGSVGINMLNSTTKVKPIMKNNKLKMRVEIRTKNELYESGSKLDLSDPKVIQFIQTEMQDQVNQLVKKALTKAQKNYKSDIFGFGVKVHQTFPKEWKKRFRKRWEQEFPKLDVEISSVVQVESTGLANKPLIWEEEEFKK